MKPVAEQLRIELWTWTTMSKESALRLKMHTKFEFIEWLELIDDFRQGVKDAVGI